MSMVINHNLMAMNAARNLNTVYSRLALSTQRLSSGLRINSAADDAAGLAIREIMRTEIAVLNQGLRNAADAISMIQTAEGALSVIDEKLTRMKELAEQASTGTYTTVQREIMDSEYQAMAREIDRIANATDFNGIKLLDGSLTGLHSGSGLKIHFGSANDADEDYYYLTIADARATEATGLQVGGGSWGDVWQTTNQWADSSNTSINATGSSAYMGMWIDGDLDTTDTNGAATSPSWFAGIYEVGDGGSLDSLVTEINQGTAARVQVTFGSNSGGDVITTSGGGGAMVLSFGTDGTSAAVNVQLYMDSSATTGAYDVAIDVSGSTTLATDVASAINSVGGDVFAIAQGSNLFVFAADAGATGNSLSAYEQDSGLAAADNANVYFHNVQTGVSANGTTNMSFAMGGDTSWFTAAAAQNANGTYELQLTGGFRGVGADVNIEDLDTLLANGTATWPQLGTVAPAQWTETQNASGVAWNGGDITTQSNAQLALAQLDNAIISKDRIRASLGSLQNRLENTITNISIQAENLQAAESRISDVDVATEMTEFTRNNIMAQAATAMLAQANSVAQLALSLLG